LRGKKEGNAVIDFETTGKGWEVEKKPKVGGREKGERGGKGGNYGEGKGF